MQFSALPVSPTVSASPSSAVAQNTYPLFGEHSGDCWRSENQDRMLGEE